MKLMKKNPRILNPNHKKINIIVNMMMLASQMEKIKLSQLVLNKLMENHLQPSKNLNKKRIVNFH
jgi:hypothetical protein